MPAASVVILDTHFPNTNFQRPPEGLAIAPAGPNLAQNPSLAIACRPPY
jgi:hypothetical protein